MLSESHFTNILNILRKYCAKSEKCSADVINRMKYYELSEELKKSAVEILEKEGYLNSNRYCEAFIKDKFKFNKWGRTKIRYALKQKNIPDEVIAENMLVIDQEDYLSTLQDLLKSKAKQYAKDDVWKLKASLHRFASSRGFEYDEIVKAITKLGI